MEKIIKILFCVAVLVFPSTGSGQAARTDSLAHSDELELPTVGYFTEQDYKVKYAGYFFQESPDGNFLTLRGGNFIENDLVKKVESFPDLSKWSINTTGYGGLELVDYEDLPSIDGYRKAWYYDVAFNKVGWGLAKVSVNFSDYKDDPVFRIYRKRKQAEREVLDSARTDILVPPVVDPPVIVDPVVPTPPVVDPPVVDPPLVNPVPDTPVVKPPVIIDPVVPTPPVVDPPVIVVPDIPLSKTWSYATTDIFSYANKSIDRRYFVGYNSTDDVRVPEVVSLPDFLPVWGVSARLDNRKTTNYKFTDFEQVVQPERSIVEKYEHNELTYYVRPRHEYDSSTLAYDLNTFPDIKIPAGKVLFNHTNYYDWKDTGLMLRVGGTYANLDSSIPFSKKSVFVGDQWLVELGMPQMYVDQVVWKGVTMNRRQAFDLWAKELDPNRLLEKFKSVFGQYRNAGHVIWNAEDNIGQWWVDRWKIEDCFRWWESINATAKLSAWGNAPYELSQIMWNGAPKLIDWGRLPQNNVEIGLNYGMTEFHKSLDIWEIGDYFNRFDSDNYIHRLLCEYFLNDWARESIGKPDIRIIPTFFSDMEHNVDAYMAHKMVERTGRNGVKYKTQVKANVLPQLMFNVAAWSMAVLDGIGKWDDPFVYLNDATDEYGSGWSAELGRNYTVMDNGAYFQYRNRKGDNYFYWAIHSLSSNGNKEIIEDKSTQWIFPKMPDVVAIEKSTLVAYKKSGDKTLVLAMAHPTAGNSTREETINIDGKDYNILLHGQWTSIIRL